MKAKQMLGEESAKAESGDDNVEEEAEGDGEDE